MTVHLDCTEPTTSFSGAYFIVTRSRLLILLCMSNNTLNIWNQIKEYPPGKRFESLFMRRQESQSRFFTKLLVISTGILIFVSGIIFLPTPIPGVVLLLIGASFIAQESLIAARSLDRAEMTLRKSARSSTSLWYKASIGIKIILSLIAISVIGVIGFSAFSLLFNA